jgi:hypothetical protein
MRRVFSNGPDRDFVINPLAELAAKTEQLFIAAPYVTKVDALIKAARSGKKVALIVGINAVTSPKALAAVASEPNIEVRYYSHSRFHAKIYVFDTSAMVGSSNLTDGGLQSNREATIVLDQEHDPDAVRELEALFSELWQNAAVLTQDVLRRFTDEYEKLPQSTIDDRLQRIVGVVEPPNINVQSTTRTAERIFLERLRRQLLQYRNAFNEVTSILADSKLHRAELKDSGDASQAGRFLAWVRETQAPGAEWEAVPLRSRDARREEILRLGGEWFQPSGDKLPMDYVSRLQNVNRTFGSIGEMEVASKDHLSEALLSLHAFKGQHRFAKDGALKEVFWLANKDDVEKVRRNLKYLVHGPGDFVSRLHDFIYDNSRKVNWFGPYCALELYGTIKSEDYPSINGRVAKGLRYLGFNVPAL